MFYKRINHLWQIWLPFLITKIVVDGKDGIVVGYSLPPEIIKGFNNTMPPILNN